jgi:hypothetical protein
VTKKLRKVLFLTNDDDIFRGKPSYSSISGQAQACIDNVYVARYFNGISQFKSYAVEARSGSRQNSLCVNVSGAQVVESRLAFPVTLNSIIISENQIVTGVQAYFVQKTGFPCPSDGIESGLHRSQSRCTTLL